MIRIRSSRCAGDIGDLIRAEEQPTLKKDHR